MSDPSSQRQDPHGTFFVDDQYDRWIFDEAPKPGPYITLAEAQAASLRRAQLASGGSPD